MEQKKIALVVAESEKDFVEYVEHRKWGRGGLVFCRFHPRRKVPNYDVVLFTPRAESNVSLVADSLRRLHGRPSLTRSADTKSRRKILELWKGEKKVAEKSVKYSIGSITEFVGEVAMMGDDVSGNFEVRVKPW